MPYKLVIFDFDGTLADSAAWFLARFNGVAERYRFPKLTPDEIEEMRGQNSREIVRRLGLPLWKLPLIARHVRQLAMDDGGGITLFPGIEAMLRHLDARGMQIAVVSSNAETTIRRTMGAAIAASIDHFECGASLFGKARRLRRVLKSSGVAASEAIFIGDETRDIEAAHQAGIAAAGVLWGYAKPAAFEGVGPMTTFATVEDITSFLAGDPPAG
ncbi:MULTISPECIES: HAD hydrolase-like protein [Rhodomicrobium]|uniref:HAD hydrolase-like protein n=1 Tax=Rhodomicrobium TaxID=1068 RepID=UPI000B4BDBB5|nr:MULTISPECIES: HAD hydrolase-like protein [Rhodomicrobium]